MLYKFTAEDDFGVEVFSIEKPSIELLEEEIGRFEKHFKTQMKVNNEEEIPF